MFLAAASQPDTLKITIGVICFLLFIVVLIYGVFNPLSRRSRRERGLPRRKWRRRKDPGKHEQDDES